MAASAEMYKWYAGSTLLATTNSIDEMILCMAASQYPRPNSEKMKNDLKDGTVFSYAVGAFTVKKTND